MVLFLEAGVVVQMVLVLPSVEVVCGEAEAEAVKVLLVGRPFLVVQVAQRPQYLVLERVLMVNFQVEAGVVGMVTGPQAVRELQDL
jgi:hypothetical protein